MEKKLKVSVSRFFPNKKSEKEYVAKLEEQKCKCHYCDINIKTHHKFHHLTNNDFVATCPICYYSQHLEELGSINNGQIILLEGLNQLDLIVLSRTIEMIKRLPVDEYEEDVDLASVLRLMLEETAEHANLYFTQGVSDVEIFAQVLTNQSDEDYEKREEGFFNLKWLPDYSIFETEINDWYEELMKDENSKYHPSKFESLLKKIEENKK